MANIKLWSKSKDVLLRNLCETKESLKEVINEFNRIEHTKFSESQISYRITTIRHDNPIRISFLPNRQILSSEKEYIYQLFCDIIDSPESLSILDENSYILYDNDKLTKTNIFAVCSLIAENWKIMLY